MFTYDTFNLKMCFLIYFFVQFLLHCIIVIIIRCNDHCIQFNWLQTRAEKGKATPLPTPMTAHAQRRCRCRRRRQRRVVSFAFCCAFSWRFLIASLYSS